MNHTKRSQYKYTIAALLFFIATLSFVPPLDRVLASIIKPASCQESIRSSNVEFNALAIDEDRCPGVMVFPGTRSGSLNAYYYLVKPYPKMNIDFEDVAYIPSFHKEGGSRSFFYAIYFPSYNETNPFDEYADVPCSKEQLKREIMKTLHPSERPADPEDINLSRLKINTLSFSIPQYYKSQGYELIYDEALSDSQNAGVIYSRGTFILEIRIPDMEHERMLEILRSDMGFPLSIRMGFKAKEQQDYKEVYIDLGSLSNDLRIKLGAKSQYFSKIEALSAIKTSSSFARVEIYAETSNIDKWIEDILLPLMSTYTTGGNVQQPVTKPNYQAQPIRPPYQIPQNPSAPAQGRNDQAETPVEDGKIYLNLSDEFKSDFKKLTFRSDVLGPNAQQEYLVYQYPLRYYGEIDGNYFVLESNRYEETERYSQIYLKAQESIEFTVEGYWEVTPKLVRHKYYFNKSHLDSGELPYIFTKDNPDFKIEEKTQDIFTYTWVTLIPGWRVGGQSVNQYLKLGHVSIEPVSWGNGYFPKYFNWKPMFPGSGPDSKRKSPSLTGTNLFDVKVPLNNLRPYGVEELLSMIPLGVRLWKGKAVAVADIINGRLSDEIARNYFTIKFDRLRKTVILTAVRDGHLYFENLDFVRPEVEIIPKSAAGSEAHLPQGDYMYIDEEDFIKIDERLYPEIETKDFARLDELADRLPRNWLGVPKYKGELPESWKPLQYYYGHVYSPHLSRSITGSRPIVAESFYPLKNPKIEVRTYIKLKIFDKD